MSATKEIKNRIRSIKSTKKVTKAMELVAGSKMKRAVTHAIASRPYAAHSLAMVHSLAKNVSEQYAHPFLAVRPVGKVLGIVITSNRSLCGGYNAQVVRSVIEFLRESPDTDFITVGAKGEAMLRRMGKTIIASFGEHAGTEHAKEAFAIASLAGELYANKTYDRVVVFYTDFVSPMTQTPVVATLLPVAYSVTEEYDNVQENVEYIVEPSYELLMDKALEKVTKTRLFQYILESAASEHSARMFAMKNASDAAGEMVDELTLVFNKARQASITQEISELSAGMASVNY